MMIDINWYLSGRNTFYGPYKIKGKDRIPSFIVHAEDTDDNKLKPRAISITNGLYDGIGDQELECKSPEEGGYTGGDKHRKILNNLMNVKGYDKKMIKSIFNKNNYTMYF